MADQMNIGTLVGYLTLDDSGVDKGTKSATQKINDFGKKGAAEGTKAGQQIGDAAGKGTVDSFGKSEGALAGKAKSMFGSVAKVGLGIMGSLGVASILTKGWDRLTGIENAKAKLKGLGNDAKSVSLIMENALASVKGTAFGLGDAATAAAGAVAANIKPGAELEGVLKAVANSAAAAGTDLNTMGSIFNKVASLGKAQNDVLQQVASQGIPIYQALADQYGVTADAVFKMASDSKISFADFEKAMKSASGTVADEMGKTTTGALANLGAAAGRTGAELLTNLMPAIKGIATAAIAGFDMAGKAAKGLFGAIGSLPGPLKTLTAAFAGLALAKSTGLISKLGDAIVLTRVKFSELSRDAGNGVLAGSLKKIGAQVGVFALVGVGIAAVVEGWKGMSRTLLDVNSLIDENTGKLVENSDALIKTSLLPYIKDLNNAGISMDHAIGGVKNGGAQLDAVNKALDAGTSGDWWGSRIRSLGRNWFSPDQAVDTINNTSKALHDAQADQAKQNEITAKAATDAANKLVATAVAAGTYRDAMDDAKTSAHEWNIVAASQGDLAEQSKSAAASLALAWISQGDAQDKAKHTALNWAAAADKLPDTVGRMTSAISAFSDQTAAADTRLQFFTLSVDKLAGRNVSLEEATKLLNDETRNLKDGFTDATKATKKHLESLIEADGQINTTTEAGSKLYDVVSNYRKAYDTATEAAVSNALATGTSTDAINAGRKAADEARAKFLEQAAALKINKGDAEKLADSMGILAGIKIPDKDFGVYVKDEATTKVAQINALKLNDKQFTAWVTMATKNEQMFGGGRESRGKATGGWIHGPGSGTSDSILARLSNKEFVVNAAAAQRHGPLLEAINAPGFATGGVVGPTSQALSGIAAPALGPVLSAVTSALAQFGQIAMDTAQTFVDATAKAKDTKDALAEQTASVRENDAARRVSFAETRKSEAERLMAAKSKLVETKKEADQSNAEAAQRVAQAKTAKARAAARQSEAKTQESSAKKLAAATKDVTKAEAARIANLGKAQVSINKAGASDLTQLNASKAANAQAQQDLAIARQRAVAVARLQKESQFLQRTQERLAGQLDTTNTALDAARTALSGLQQQSEQLSGSISGKLVGDSSITGLNAGSTVQNIIDALSGKASATSGVSSSIQALSGSGLNKQILQDIAGMGLSGGPLASTLAGASSAQIAQINSLQDQISKAANSAGSAVANSIYANDINLWQTQVSYLDQRQAELTASLQKNADQLSASIAQALEIQTKMLSPTQIVDRLTTIVADNKALPTRITQAIRKAG